MTLEEKAHRVTLGVFAISITVLLITLTIWLFYGIVEVTTRDVHSIEITEPTHKNSQYNARLVMKSWWGKTVWDMYMDKEGKLRYRETHKRAMDALMNENFDAIHAKYKAEKEK